MVGVSESVNSVYKLVNCHDHLSSTFPSPEHLMDIGDPTSTEIDWSEGWLFTFIYVISGEILVFMANERSCALKTKPRIRKIH